MKIPLLLLAMTSAVHCWNAPIAFESKNFHRKQFENTDDTVSDDERVAEDVATHQRAEGLSYPRDCTDVFMYYLSGNRTSHSGIYKVYNPKWYSLGPTGMTLLPIYVFCDMRTSGGGWTMFQRRQDGSEDFYRSYHDYDHGFGKVEGEHWLGLRFIHIITALRPSVLQINMVARSDNTASYVRYGDFKVADGSGNYKLTVGSYSGNDTQGDMLGNTLFHNGHYFSTYDRDQDNLDRNGAEAWKTGFWIGGSIICNLNGLYNNILGPTGIFWGSNPSPYHKKYVTMSFRPRSLASKSKYFNRNQVSTDDDKPQALMDGYYYEGPHTTDTDSAGNTDAGGHAGVQGFRDDEQEETPPVTSNVTTTLPLRCEHVRLLARKPPAAGCYVVYRPEHYSSGDHGFQMVGHSVYCDFGNAKEDAMLKCLNRLQLENANDTVSDDEPVAEGVATHQPAGGLSYARDCADVFMYYLSGDRGNQSGTYKVYNPQWYSLGPTGITLLPIYVYCDMRTSGGGWTMFQRRQDGSEDFFRGYHDYEHGFGKVDGEYWLGLRFIHMITALRPSVLQINMVQRSDRATYVRYGDFKVADDSEKYKLTVGNYSGDDPYGDILGDTEYHNGHYFSTYDRDQDTAIGNSAESYKTGFWLGSSIRCNLNGLYNVTTGLSGIWWANPSSKYLKKYATMSFRPESYQ